MSTDKHREARLIETALNVGKMRLLWKKYDSKFDPLVAIVGLGMLIAGVWGVPLMNRALRNPVLWVVAAIPLLAGIIGAVTLVRECQLWKARSDERPQ